MPVYRRRMDRQNIYGGQLTHGPGHHQNSYTGVYSSGGRHSHEDAPYDPRRGEHYIDQDPRGLLLAQDSMFAPVDYGRMQSGHLSLPVDTGSLLDSGSSFPPNFDPQQSYSLASSMQSGYHADRSSAPQYGYSQQHPGSGSFSTSHHDHYRGGSNDGGQGIPPSAFNATPPMSSSMSLPDPDEYLRLKLKLPPGTAMGLWVLEDPEPGQRPPHSYPMLVRLAIAGSPHKRLTLKGIYQAIEDRFEFYKNDPKGAWKGSIRHNLSLNQIFKNVTRPLTEPGKGNYWEVDHSKGEGYKRDRKRKSRKQSSKAGDKVQSDDDDEFDDFGSEATDGGEDSGPGHSSSGPTRSSRVVSGRRHSPYASPNAGPTRLPLSPRTNPHASLTNAAASFYDPNHYPPHDFSSIGGLRSHHNSASPPGYLNPPHDSDVGSSPEGTPDYTSSNGYDDATSFMPKGKGRYAIGS